MFAFKILPEETTKCGQAFLERTRALKHLARGLLYKN